MTSRNREENLRRNHSPVWKKITLTTNGKKRCIMNRSCIFLLSIALIILLVGCTEDQTPMPKEVQLTEKGLACEPGSSVGLNVSDTLVLVLDGNPSTGYTWEVGFYTAGVIEPAGEPEYQPNSNLVGAGGTYTFRFLAVGEGESVLRLIYHRPFEKDVLDLKVCEVTVIVE